MTNATYSCFKGEKFVCAVDASDTQAALEQFVALHGKMRGMWVMRQTSKRE